MDTGYNQGYTLLMKTAVSIPDPIFKAAERAAKRAKISRSRFYAVALANQLSRERDEAVREALDKVNSKENSELDPFLETAAYQLFSRVKW